ncbi:vacuolar membrane PQ loop repeat protein [Verticillium dahliae VdLs.17]|uniref:Vacuolar membrane PQ loop repeat protein n=1 Tax=Verticillium dahliae (strain VdLs.17 / ATCC MYA-4575 / FGSC 10137) TaxID=498257 RepID=G2WXX9_VERDV|nr:vacuolar membrane PQ loop repeat protein [Verticillium dahliae VdLs.17]EGY20937.1 vacuolar membrane PQ loop repeat protein [Verticillium dahliae VdLs.17]
MASIIPTAIMALSHHTPTVRDSLSGIFGSISLTAWICLLLPQLIANYRAQSADGLSMGFLFIWLLGDITNLVAREHTANSSNTLGALFTHLAPSAVALAFYFCIADIVLISQSIGRHEVHTETSLEPLRKIVTGEDDTPDSNPWLHNTLSLLAVWLVGAAGWFISYKAGAWDADHGSSDPQSPEEDGIMAKVGLALGYFSAVCYLLARVPQIVKNYREKSCEGLALLFFLLSLTGNLSYGASLIAYSQDPHYLLKALPWLVGSLGTIAEDMVIFAQFHLYASERTSVLASAA